MPSNLQRLREIVAKLRAPDGCPWDREQTHESLLPSLLEECYEVIEAVNQKDGQALQDELGDLLLQPFIHAQIAAESGRFSIDEVAGSICEKLIRRHPHVFGNSTADDTHAVLRQWEEIKHKEKSRNDGSPVSRMDGVPTTLPALAHATKVQKKAARAGFDWKEPAHVIAKIREELDELETELATRQEDRVAEELGDLLFSVVNLARKLNLDAEFLLRAASEKFIARFRAMEASGKTLETLDSAALETLWESAKSQS